MRSSTMWRTPSAQRNVPQLTPLKLKACGWCAGTIVFARRHGPLAVTRRSFLAHSQNTSRRRAISRCGLRRYTWIPIKERAEYFQRFREGVTVELIEGGGHCVQDETPEVVAAAILRWLPQAVAWK
mmetsp:Transcript_11333/g.30283  ORF Transcript_11333/g.30283 Transcript_11333/m.30283 type:complete len:126 (+) Transcript_11333:77-454(+)